MMFALADDSNGIPRGIYTYHVFIMFVPEVIISERSSSTIGIIVYLILMSFPTALRLQNIGWHPKWTVLMLIPPLNVFVMLAGCTLSENQTSWSRKKLISHCIIIVLFGLVGSAMFAFVIYKEWMLSQPIR